MVNGSAAFSMSLKCSRLATCIPICKRLPFGCAGTRRVSSCFCSSCQGRINCIPQTRPLQRSKGGGHKGQRLRMGTNQVVFGRVLSDNLACLKFDASEVLESKTVVRIGRIVCIYNHGHDDVIIYIYTNVRMYIHANIICNLILWKSELLKSRENSMTTQLTEVSAAVKGSKKKFHFPVAGDPTETVCLLRFCFASDMK